MSMELVLWTLLAGVVSALATGVGALGALFIPQKRLDLRAFAGAAAAGMMVAASLFSLVGEGLEMEAPVAGLQVVAGLLGGAAFFWWVERRFGEVEEVSRLERRSWMVFVAMFIHSIPEGVALGVGFATGEWMVGVLMAVVIAVHNIPEGLAISLPIRAEGGSLGRCVGFSILSSVPQPVLAVPALLGFVYVQALLPVGLGFAAGAMLYLSFVELVPTALKESDPQTAAWGLMTGLTAMLLMTMGLNALLG